MQNYYNIGKYRYIKGGGAVYLENSSKFKNTEIYLRYDFIRQSHFGGNRER